MLHRVQPCMILRGIVACLGIWGVATQKPKKTPTSIKNDGRVPGLLLSMFGLDCFQQISPVLASQKKADPEVITYQAAFLKDARQVANLQALHNPSLSSPKRVCFRPWTQFCRVCDCVGLLGLYFCDHGLSGRALVTRIVPRAQT